jgi:hypothetical protein
MRPRSRRDGAVVVAPPGRTAGRNRAICAVALPATPALGHNATHGGLTLAAGARPQTHSERHPTTKVRGAAAPAGRPAGIAHPRASGKDDSWPG